MKYTARYKPEFLEDMTTYASMKARIEKKVLAILDAPYHNTEPLEKRPGHDLRGIRSKRIDRNFRILFTICEECRRLFPDKGKACRYCDPKLPAGCIIFFTVKPHKVVYLEDKPIS
ncbi:MAG: hypothetical protein C0390_12095 [Syntrophus sp. (in: bacteria)]|nr:hypothetical protein [Syntrophus sp. (in: bacteria)]